jgi:hypothetical protein
MQRVLTYLPTHCKSIYCPAWILILTDQTLTLTLKLLKIISSQLSSSELIDLLISLIRPCKNHKEMKAEA